MILAGLLGNSFPAVFAEAARLERAILQGSAARFADGNVTKRRAGIIYAT